MSASERGISLIQIVAVIAIAGIIVLVAMPPLREMHEGMRLDAAARRVLSDMRTARSLAVTTGWQFRFVGLRDDGRYRVLGRRSTAVAWPDIDVAVFSGDTQLALPWTHFGDSFPGVELRPFDSGAPAEYWISFDSRGVPIEISTGLVPIAIIGKDGSSRLVTVAQTGRMALE